ncbi:MAG: DUF4416 family protein [Deltaproteobacteria bacterium]|nr:DUF4416 family protein [Deltaproteobacteria bacterium]
MKPSLPKSVNLITSIFSAKEGLIDEVMERLVLNFGALDFKSALLDFVQTDYYESELGPCLKRRIISFSDLIEIERLIEIKLFTNSMEQDYLSDAKRQTNIDPGYLSLERVVLATCKDFAHRIYLGKGVYADLTLVYRGKDFRPLEWTYPDYASDELRHILREIRSLYSQKRAGNVQLHDRLRQG